MSGGMNFDFTMRAPDGARRRDAGSPFRILVLSDFSGRGSRGVREDSAAIMSRPVRKVDVDEFYAELERVGPKVQTAAGTIDVSDIDDFHPDTLYDRLDVFAELRSKRKRLMDPSTFAEEVAALSRADDSGGEADEGGETTFDQLLGGSTGGAPAVRAGGAQVNLDAFIANLVGKHIVPGPDPRQDQYVSSVDAAISDLMRSVLADPSFQVVERAWRSLHGLVTGVETDENLEVAYFDITRDELFEDLKAGGPDLSMSGFVRKAIESAGGPGGQPWSLIVGDFIFEPELTDIGFLAALGGAAAGAGAAFVAGASPRFLGLDTIHGHADHTTWGKLPAEVAGPWGELKKSELAKWIGLGFPRVLLRLPYGKKTDEVDRFEFEEVNVEAGHDSLLWGTPGFAIATLLARSFTMRGWSMEPGDELDLDDRPAWTVEEDGEKKLYPCAEAYISERGAEALLPEGFIPILSWKNRPAVHVVRFQSLAGTTLGGPWA
ncbi:MAG: type VI secretion system contractile sheath large subunit [Planctomycetota bacterium]